jgi:hypothetical protein
MLEGLRRKAGGRRSAVPEGKGVGGGKIGIAEGWKDGGWVVEGVMPYFFVSLFCLKGLD